MNALVVIVEIAISAIFLYMIIGGNSDDDDDDWPDEAPA